MVWLATFASGCAALRAGLSQPAPVDAPPRVDDGNLNAPEWRRGDRWIFEWTSGEERGTRTVEVLEATTVNDVPYYVIEIGPTTQQYYTKDLHFAASVQASRVLARMVPPQPWFAWPMKVGTKWDYHGSYEEQQGAMKHNDSFTVVGIDQVSVPGGTFRAYRIVRQTDRGDADQYWYAPEARWYVRWLGRRGEMQFEEMLKAYQPAPRGGG
jgi:hypothetical protein